MGNDLLGPQGQFFRSWRGYGYALISADEDGADVFEHFKERMLEGTIDDAIIVFRAGDKAYFQPVTTSSYERFGWLLFRTMLALAVDQDVEED